MPENETKTVRKSRGLRLTEAEVAPSNHGTDVFPEAYNYPDQVAALYPEPEEQDFLTDRITGFDKDDNITSEVV